MIELWLWRVKTRHLVQLEQILNFLSENVVVSFSLLVGSWRVVLLLLSGLAKASCFLWYQGCNLDYLISNSQIVDYLIVPLHILYQMRWAISFLVEKEFPTPAFLCMLNLLHSPDDKSAYVDLILIIHSNMRHNYRWKIDIPKLLTIVEVDRLSLHTKHVYGF